MLQSRETLNRFTDAATEAVARTIVSVQREAARERELREAQFAARMAELGSKIQSIEELERRLSERLTSLKDGRDGADGRSIAVDDVRPVVAEYVEHVLAGWDRPKDGTSVSVDDVEPVLRDMVEAKFASLPVPKDGADGKDGTSVDHAEVMRMITEAVAALPKAKDGENGKDGRDGVDGKDGAPGERGPQGEPGIDGKDGADGPVGATGEPGERGEKGDKGDAGPMGSLPLVEDWQDKVYYEGQICGLDGAIYQAARDTGKAPGHADWRCIVQRGVDGADGQRGEQGPQGKQGKQGPRGERGATAVDHRLSEDGQHMITKFSDGHEVVCDMYPVFSRFL